MKKNKEKPLVVDTLFDAEGLLNKGWEILMKEQDKKSAKIKNLSFNQIRLLSCFKKREDYISGEEYLRRLRNLGRILYGATIFASLWQDYQEKKKESFLERLCAQNKKFRSISFFGDIIVGPDDEQYVMYFYRNFDGDWLKYCMFLDDYWENKDVVAVSRQKL